jgi:hypothetical protein
MQSKDTVDRLRSSLETQKSTIEIALQCGSIQILCAIQKQVEKPAQDFTRLASNTQAIQEDIKVLRGDALDLKNQIRQDTKVLQRDAVDIKALICHEADVLRAEIASLKRDKPLSTDLQDFLKLSQEYSNRIADPFATPAQSDAGGDDMPMEACSRPSPPLTSERLIDLAETPARAEQEEDAEITCASCGQRTPGTRSPAESKSREQETPAARDTSRETSNVPDEILLSSANEFAREPSRGFSKAEPPAVDPTVKVVVKCENDTFTTTLGKDAGPTAIQEWIFSILKPVEANEELWVEGITKPEDIDLRTAEGTKFITYPDDRLSDLARIYGSGGRLELRTSFICQISHDSLENIEIVGWYVERSDSFSFLLKNDNHFRPAAWCFDDNMTTVIKSPNGGILPPNSSQRASLEARSGHYSGQVIIHAILMKPEDNPQHWKRLILTSATKRRGTWKATMHPGGQRGFSRELKRIIEQESADSTQPPGASRPRAPPAHTPSPQRASPNSSSLLTHLQRRADHQSPSSVPTSVPQDQNANTRDDDFRAFLASGGKAVIPPRIR